MGVALKGGERREENMKPLAFAVDRDSGFSCLLSPISSLLSDIEPGSAGCPYSSAP
jgi:hypothetical protein